MKFRALVAWLATLAWLAGSTAWGQSSPLFQDSSSRFRVASSNASRLVPPPMSKSMPASPDPEQISTPAKLAPTESEFEPDDGYSSDCDTCGDDCWAAGRCRGGLWYGGVDYLLVRPRFSQNTAFVQQTNVTDSTVTPNTSTQTSQSVQFPFKYSSSFRASLGYRLLDCGGDVQFTYWRLTGSSQISAQATTDVSYFGQLGVDPEAGNTLTASTGVTANIYDFDFAKCLSLGGPSAPCDACFCPRWDLRWNAGVRLGDVSRFDNNFVSNGTSTVQFGNINTRFVGAGPRVGCQGRRYFGQCGLLSLYARGNMSLLIGDYRSGRVMTRNGSDTETTTTFAQSDSMSRIVPVTDIELGGSWQIAPYTFVSAGWFWQAWWDLGQSESIPGLAFPPLDTSNILGFDGLFIRGEMLF